MDISSTLIHDPTPSAENGRDDHQKLASTTVDELKMAAEEFCPPNNEKCGAAAGLLEARAGGSQKKDRL